MVSDMVIDLMRWCLEAYSFDKFTFINKDHKFFWLLNGNFYFCVVNELVFFQQSTYSYWSLPFWKVNNQVFHKGHILLSFPGFLVYLSDETQKGPLNIFIDWDFKIKQDTLLRSGFLCACNDETYNKSILESLPKIPRNESCEMAAKNSLKWKLWNSSRWMIESKVFMVGRVTVAVSDYVILCAFMEN